MYFKYAAMIFSGDALPDANQMSLAGPYPFIVHWDS